MSPSSRPLVSLLAASRGFHRSVLVIALVLLSAPAESQEPPPSPAPETPIERPLGAPAGPPRQGAELERATEDLASRMRCPVCQGLSIADSPSESAVNMRNEVRELLEQGYSPEQVISYFEQAYGEFVRLVPKPRGFNLLVWILPLAALVLGGFLVARFSRRPPSADEPVLDDYLDRVREDTTG